VLKEKGIISSGEENWQWLWKLKLPYKIIHFLWLLRQDKILTATNRVKRGMGLDPNYKLCGQNETIIHIFKECWRSKQVWSNIGMNVDQGNGNMCISTWLDTNLKEHNLKVGNEVTWSTMFGITIWCLWLMRNELVFRNSQQNH